MLKSLLIFMGAVVATTFAINAFNIEEIKCNECVPVCRLGQNYTSPCSPYVDPSEGVCDENHLLIVKRDLIAMRDRANRQRLFIDQVIESVNGHLANGKYYTFAWRRIVKCGLGAAYSGAMTSDQFSASSIYKNSAKRHPSNSRLNQPVSEYSDGGWLMDVPYTTNGDEYIQIDLGMTRTVTGVVTQGQANGGAWVTSYKVEYSQLMNFGYTRVHDEKWYPKVFVGNTDYSTPVIGNFHVFANARYIRIYPLEWHNWPALRVEILGC